jgi:uncharacterized membrane protein YfcA
MLDYAWGLAVIALAAALQAITGFGFSLMAVPLVALVWEPSTAIVATGICALALTGTSTWRERAHVRRADALVVWLAACAGMPIGVLVLRHADAPTLRALIALSLLACTALLWRGLRLPTGRWVQGGVGFVSGLLITSTGINGPPVVLAFQAQGMPQRNFRATLAAVFAAQRVVALGMIGAAGLMRRDALGLAALGVPAVLLGWELGNRVFHRLDPRLFRRLVLVLLLVSAAVTLASALRDRL